MNKAREANPRWQYHARPFLIKKKLRMYLYESDYRREWGNQWSPRASGVRILYPHICPVNGVSFPYLHNERPSDPDELAQWQQVWDAALGVPLNIWLGGHQ